jgi:hypothetical protein
MATSLNGTTPQATYESLLKLGDNSALTSTLKVVSDGAGNDTLLFVSTTALAIGTSTAGVNRFTIRGAGATSATTALRVENSAGTSALTVNDVGQVNIGLSTGINWLFSSNTLTSSQYAFIVSSNGSILSTGFSGGVFGNNNGGRVADNGINTAQVASAVLEVSSTTLGFLPPRMTTTQKNAIATPAAGLVVYDTTTNKLCCYDGSTWNDLF